MKRDLNLILQRNAKSKTQKVFFTTLVITLIIALVMYVGLYMPITREIDMKNKLKALNESNLNNAKTESQYISLTKEKSYNNLVKMIFDAQKNMTTATQTSDRIFAAMSEDITFTSYNAGAYSITIVGYAKDESSVAVFIDKLLKYPEYESVWLDYVKDDDTGKKSFSLTIELPKPTPKPSIKPTATGGKAK